MSPPKYPPQPKNYSPPPVARPAPPQFGQFPGTEYSPARYAAPQAPPPERTTLGCSPATWVVLAAFSVVSIVVIGWATVLMASIGHRTIYEPSSPLTSIVDVNPTSVPIVESDFAAESRLADVAIGDCFQIQNYGEDDMFGDSVDTVVVDELEIVNCTVPHDAEVFDVVTLPYDSRAAYPGDSDTYTWASELCNGSIEAYIRGPLEADYTSDTFYPSPWSWRLGDRQAICYVASTSGRTLTESLAGG